MESAALLLLGFIVNTNASWCYVVQHELLTLMINASSCSLHQRPSIWRPFFLASAVLISVVARKVLYFWPEKNLPHLVRLTSWYPSVWRNKKCVLNTKAVHFSKKWYPPMVTFKLFFDKSPIEAPKSVKTRAENVKKNLSMPIFTRSRCFLEAPWNSG